MRRAMGSAGVTAEILDVAATTGGAPAGATGVRNRYPSCLCWAERGGFFGIIPAEQARHKGAGGSDACWASPRETRK